ncbi:MAG TPA: DegT/DnrJ/EryC1/StrS family aminotransferase [Candidatus Methylacidiphilales bacterium]|nr:DegT/DnrJ/EryC1/StrS family aminotransferase [Candidatus Methylacidiphilales bacterium]
MNLTTCERASCLLFDIVAGVKGKWIIPENVCYAVYGAVVKAGAEVLLCDVDAKTLALDVELTLQLVASHEDIAGVVYVRTYGDTSQDCTAFFARLRSASPDIIIVDDHCLAPPQFEISKPIADVYLFSTGYSKVVDLGYGGYAYSQMALQHRNSPYTQEASVKFDQFIDRIIDNSQPVSDAEFQAEASSEWLKSGVIDSQPYFDAIHNALDKAIETRKRINRIYDQLEIFFRAGAHFNQWRYIIKVENREEIVTRLRSEKLYCGQHFYPLSYFTGKEGNHIWKRIYPGILNLFNDFRYTEEQALRTVEVIQNHGRPWPE